MRLVPFAMFAEQTGLFPLELTSKVDVSSLARCGNALPQGGESLDVATVLLRW